MTLFYFYVSATGFIAFALMWMLFPLRQSRKIQLITLGFMAPAILLSYHHWGSLTAWKQFEQNKHQQVRLQNALAQFNNPQQVIAKMQQQLAQNPESAQGWYLLGKLYLSQSQPEKAIFAFSSAQKLSPDDDKITLNLAQSYILARDYQKGLTILNLMKKKPSFTVEALSLAAMANYQVKNYRQAIDEWRQLSSLIPPDSPDQQLIEQAIKKAQFFL